MGFFDFMTEDIAIDLGTANTLIIHNDKVVVDEPSIVAFDRTTNKVIAIGRQAMQMEGKTHDNIRTVRPLKDGVIADCNAAGLMIRGMIKMINQGKGWFFPSLRMVICIPSGITEVEKRAVHQSAEKAGAKEVYLIHEPMAAAVGIGIDVEEPMGNMIIDIGGGTTEIAVIALSGIVCDQSIRVAGDNFDSDIVQYIRRQHNIMIGDRTAEKIKIEVAILKALEITPPELSADIYQTGIYLTGSGALLRGLDRRVSAKTKLPVHVAEDPLRAVVRGTGIALKNIGGFKFLMQ